jgi:metalloprotease
MKTKSIVLIVVFAAIGITKSSAQINVGEQVLGALQNGVASFTFSNEDAAKLSKEAVKKMDSTNTVAPSNNGYNIRLNRIFAKHSNENGLALNYKVYLTKDVNAFATADGSVRVFSGLMDIMDDNQLLAVIGHEIGHVANEDSKDAMKAALRKSAIIGAASAESDKIAAVTNSQLGQIANAMIDSKHSRKQESEADLYSYNFMKSHVYDVNAVESAFNILANMGSSDKYSEFLSKMMSSHPDPKDRADTAKARAESDGLYKPYIQQPINNSGKALKIIPKKPVKKATKKK